MSLPESMLPVAILAGGLATRLRPITETIPKALLEIAGRPFVFRQLEYLKEQGVDRVVLCVGYLGEQIRAAVGTGADFGLEVLYSEDGPNLLGTGGAIRKALPLLGNSFFVLYGDSYLPCDFHRVQQTFSDSGMPALMTVLRNEGRWDQSNVLFREGRIVEYNKRNPRPEMDYIDYGLGILSADVLQAYPPAEPFDIADVYNKLSLESKLAGCEVDERFYEIGSHAGLQDIEEYFTRRGSE